MKFKLKVDCWLLVELITLKRNSTSYEKEICKAIGWGPTKMFYILLTSFL